MDKIKIKIDERIAEIESAPEVVTDNAEYEVEFAVDERDGWNPTVPMTALFVRRDARYTAVVMDAGETICTMPPQTGTNIVYVGLTQGDMRTTTPATIKVYRSIRTVASDPLPAPTEDVYAQILAAYAGIKILSGKGAPTLTTQGKVNQLYRDEDTQRLYICTATGGGYTWAEVSGGSVDVDATLTKAGYAADAKAAGDAIEKKLDKTALPTAVNYALAQAKASGEFDGAKGDKGDTGPEGPKGADGKDGAGMDVTGAKVGQIAKITAVDSVGKPTAWEPVNMPSGGGVGGHWETVLDTVWEQDVINPTAFNSGTGIFTCAEGELNNLELNKAYVFFPQCVKEGVAYNTIINNASVEVTKLSDTTFSINVTPPTTFVPANIKFSKGACLAITDIDAKKIRLTLDGQFQPTSTLYDKPFYGTDVPYFGKNTGYIQIRNAYQAYQQVTAEVESPYRIVGEILCGFNTSSQNPSFHFKHNSFCCPLVPYDVPEGFERTYLLNSGGTKIAKLYSTKAPWFVGGGNNNLAVSNDYLKIISGTKVKLERWAE